MSFLTVFAFCSIPNLGRNREGMRFRREHMVISIAARRLRGEEFVTRCA